MIPGMEQCCLECLMPLEGHRAADVYCMCGCDEAFLICNPCEDRIKKNGWAGFGIQRVPESLIINNMISPIGVRLMVATTAK